MKLHAFSYKIYVIKLLCLSFLLIQHVNAADTWISSTGILTAPIVKYSDNRYYTNVMAVLNKVITTGSTCSAGSASTSYDTYNSTTGYLTIPEVKVVATSGATTTYCGVVASLSSITSVGGICGDSASCAKYYTPAQFGSILAYSKVPTRTLATAFTNRTRYMIADANSTTSTTANYLSIGSTYSASTGYSAESGTVPASSTYKNYLSKLFQVVTDSTDSSGYFRIDSHLHPNNSLDADSSASYTLKFRNNFGKAATTYGYVVFSYNNSTKLLQAVKRYKYSYDSTTYRATYTEDTAFASSAPKYVNLSSGVFKLVTTTAEATKLYLFTTSDVFGIPCTTSPCAASTMNPTGTRRYESTSTNKTPAGFVVKTVTTSVTLGTKYANQVSASGGNSTTKTNADAMLASIKTALATKGETLRYDTAVYTAFRDAALSNVLSSDAISNGVPGQNLVPYVWYTNEQDSSGNYHPFMMIVNYGNPASPHGLLDVPDPPGATGGYVTRYSNLDNYITAIPLKNYGTVSTVTANTRTSSLLSDVTLSTTDVSLANVYNYASTADNGIAVDGSVMFPAYNNTLYPSQWKGELSGNGCHVGQGGGGPHCHADGFYNGASVGTSSAPPIALYNDNDYVNKTHPPLIGFGYDGVALFGRYRSADTAMLGYSTALNAFGGHDHDGIGWHYHAHVVAAGSAIPSPRHSTESSTATYQLNVLMKGAYIGSTNSIPCFKERTTCTNADINKYYYGL
jgi:hypothetical protein